MDTAVFSTCDYDKLFLTKRNFHFDHQLNFFETKLSIETVSLASKYTAVCAFVNDNLDKNVIEVLAEGQTKLIALRSAGFNNVDLKAAKEFDITVVRVPAYSPHAVAEHSLALILSLNRKIHRAYNRVREGNFQLEGLLGFDLSGRTIGVIGTGRIGSVLAKIVHGLGCHILAHDPIKNNEILNIGAKYCELDELFSRSDIISLHCPLTPETNHLIDDIALSQMRDGVMIINTSRGAVIDTKAIIRGLKSEKIGALGLDVYEEEADLFFRDLSDKVIQDDLFARLTTFPNVLITGHQGFFTEDALERIANTTLANISAFENSQPENTVTFEEVHV